MKDASSLIAALAAIAWPLVLGVLLWKMAPMLKSRLSSGNLKIKVMGVEVESAQGASDTLSKQIVDLQDRYGELKVAIESSHPGVLPHALIRVDQINKERVLWVDDRPDYNAFEVARLRHDGVSVDQVTSTDDALRALTHERYSMVITDMERPEGGRDEPRAGLLLIQRMKDNGLSVPVFVYCSPFAIEQFEQEILTSGAAGATASPLELFEGLGISSFRPTSADLPPPDELSISEHPARLQGSE